MGRLVFAAATSHVGAIVKDAGADPAVSGVLHAAWRELDGDIAAAEPDAVVVVATDHYETFGLENYPAYCLGIAEEHHGWGEFGNPAGAVRGRPGIAEGLLAGLTERGFEAARSHTMRLDHSFTVPLAKLPSAKRGGIVPLFVNCNTAPLPSLRRCLALGAALGETIRALPGGMRVGVLATGGLSHWVGLPRFGEINERFDRDLLALLERRRAVDVLDWSDDRIAETAGNGALELRTWLIAAGAAGGRARVYAYRPMPAWTVGIGIARFEVAAAAEAAVADAAEAEAAS